MGDVVRSKACSYHLPVSMCLLVVLGDEGGGGHIIIKALSIRYTTTTHRSI